MTLSFKAAMVGPSRAGKTSLITAILAQTEDLLAGSEIELALDEVSEARIRDNQRELRRAIEAREFVVNSLGGTQSSHTYEVTLRPLDGGQAAIPFSILDYPGGWIDPAARARSTFDKAEWAECEEHITESLMLLLPVDAAVLMEARTPEQSAAMADLLAFTDVEAVTRKWARARNRREHREEPAVLVLAPVKCEKYFDDNSRRGRSDAARLRELVREKYRQLLSLVAQEARDRQIRVVYAPVDTYGCVELMEAEWHKPESPAGGPSLTFKGHYRFREFPPRLRPKAADTVTRELCRCVVAGQRQAARQRAEAAEENLGAALQRKAEPKGFWGALDFYLSGEARENRQVRAVSQAEVVREQRSMAQLAETLHKLAALTADPRVEEW